MKNMRNIWRFLAVIALVGGLAACKKDKEPEGPADLSGGCEAVDLGLSVKWAAYNVGAKKEDGYGSYFAWAETTEKGSYDWSKEGEYKWGIFGVSDYLSKYMVDHITTLQPEDDPATKNWGAKWRTPTIAEINELHDETKCEWKWDAARKGYVVKGLKTGNSIFLPAAGYRNGTELRYAGEDGNYWSASVLETYQYNAHNFIFNSGLHKPAVDNRCFGMSVRAVTKY